MITCICVMFLHPLIELIDRGIEKEDKEKWQWCREQWISRFEEVDGSNAGSNWRARKTMRCTTTLSFGEYIPNRGPVVIWCVMCCKLGLDLGGLSWPRAAISSSSSAGWCKGMDNKHWMRDINLIVVSKLRWSLHLHAIIVSGLSNCVGRFEYPLLRYPIG